MTPSEREKKAAEALLRKIKAHELYPRMTSFECERVARAVIAALDVEGMSKRLEEAEAGCRVLHTVERQRIAALRSQLRAVEEEKAAALYDARSWSEAVDCKGEGYCVEEGEIGERCWTHELKHVQAQLSAAESRLHALRGENRAHRGLLERAAKRFDSMSKAWDTRLWSDAQQLLAEIRSALAAPPEGEKA
jgi:hypothetical protein